MINPELKLNPKIFDKDVEQVPIRKGFGEGLLRAAERDKRIVGLCADLAESTCMNLFRDKFPERFVEVGVAEQNLASVASGMAAMGKIPFIGSFAIFSPCRNWEQIRTTICYNNLPVKIVGSHAGLSASQDGGSHQMLEDIALMRVLPRMTIISPCDAIEAKKATIFASKTDTPTYIRLTRNATPIITTEESPFEIGRAQVVFDSNLNNQSGDKNPSPLRGTPFKKGDFHASVCIIATGHLLYKALLVAKRLTDEGKGVIVVNLSTIKPLDENTIIKVAQEVGAIVTVEEHQIIGGMGSAVAECLAGHIPVPIEFVGVNDKFGQSGQPEELLDLYGLGEKDIYNAAKKAMLRKR
ncbi:MAG: transketolase C-terminal domain-containing protein [Candidatus Paceibacterota bacterium]|jgi:transketolase